MRIVDRKTFLEMPAGTVYMIFPTQPNDPMRELYIELGAELTAP